MTRFGALIAGLALAGGMAHAGTPLPAGYGGGFLPPTATDSKTELKVSKNLSKLSGSVNKCHTKGVTNVLKSKPDGVAACDLNAFNKYVITANKLALTAAACINGPAQAALGGTVAGLVASFDPTIWCDGTTPLPAGFAGGFQPTTAATFKAESLVAKALIKHSAAVTKCASKGVTNLVKGAGVGGPDGGLNVCLNDPAKGATTKTNASLAKIVGIPTCLATNPLATANTVTALTLAFNPQVFCASPSGAFLN